MLMVFTWEPVSNLKNDFIIYFKFFISNIFTVYVPIHESQLTTDLIYLLFLLLGHTDICKIPFHTAIETCVVSSWTLAFFMLMMMLVDFVNLLNFVRCDFVEFFLMVIKNFDFVNHSIQ
ncbi:hypothetical protein ACKWTF_011911 [Chironomus riparius]